MGRQSSVKETTLRWAASISSRSRRLFSCSIGGRKIVVTDSEHSFKNFTSSAIRCCAPVSRRQNGMSVTTTISSVDICLAVRAPTSSQADSISETRFILVSVSSPPHWQPCSRIETHPTQCWIESNAKPIRQPACVFVSFESTIDCELLRPKHDSSSSSSAIVLIRWLDLARQNTD